MKQKHNIRFILLISAVSLVISGTSHSVSYTSSTLQLELAKKTFNAALLCSQDYKNSKSRSLNCLADHAAMRSKTKQKKLARWLSMIQLISINHCNTTELQMAKSHSQHIPDIPHLVACVHYYQKPFQKTAMVTIGQADNASNWKIIAVKEL